MENKLNKYGDRRGFHKPKYGKEHHAAKGWILYKDNEEVGFFGTLREAAEYTGVHTGMYLWQLAKGKAKTTKGVVRKVTSYGWSIKPADVLETKAI